MDQNPFKMLYLEKVRFYSIGCGIGSSVTMYQSILSLNSIRIISERFW